MTLPNFLIIGAEKSATTALYNYLAEHPQIFMSRIKEPRFFSHEDRPPFEGIGTLEDLRARGVPLTTTRDGYEALFAGAGEALAIGEASPNYLSTHAAARRIHDLIPHARMVVSLRNPVDRAYSFYWMMVREDKHPRSFEVELDAAFAELAALGTDALDRLPPEDFPFLASAYLIKGLYARHIRYYLSLFPREQFLFLRFEDIERDPAQVSASVFKFLGVDENYALKNREAFGRSGEVSRPGLVRAISRFRYGRLLRRFLPGWMVARTRNRLMNLAVGGYPPMAPETRARLLDFFRSDILETEKLLGWDLKAWLQKTSGGAAR